MKRTKQRRLPAYRRRKRARLSVRRRQVAPGIPALDLWRQTKWEATLRAERWFGKAAQVKSPTVRFRWSNRSQADWKGEVGHWMQAAEVAGFADAMFKRMTIKGSRYDKPHANDGAHLKLNQGLAPAKVTHYLVGTGWRFVSHDPVTGGAVDIDLRLASPNGTVADFQIKASDQPGYIRNHRRHDGEDDSKVVDGIDNAWRQLPRDGANPAFIVMCAQRIWPLSLECGFVISKLIGSTHSTNGGPVFLWKSRGGDFFSPEWAHVSGLVMLDYVRAHDIQYYACTVLLNPFATHRASADWFPRARVLILDSEDHFRWVRGSPGPNCFMPDATPLIRNR